MSGSNGFPSAPYMLPKFSYCSYATAAENSPSFPIDTPRTRSFVLKSVIIAAILEPFSVNDSMGSLVENTNTATLRHCASRRVILTARDVRESWR